MGNSLWSELRVKWATLSSSNKAFAIGSLVGVISIAGRFANHPVLPMTVKPLDLLELFVTIAFWGVVGLGICRLFALLKHFGRRQPPPDSTDS